MEVMHTGLNKLIPMVDFEYSNVIEVDAGNIPDGFVLEQNYPNPFNPIYHNKICIGRNTKRGIKNL